MNRHGRHASQPLIDTCELPTPSPDRSRQTNLSRFVQRNVKAKVGPVDAHRGTRRRSTVWETQLISTALKARLRAIHGWRGLKPHAKTHFSQEGEDLLLSRIFHAQARGTYIDIGAHHARRFSNSYWAYLRGWSGVAIDPSEGAARSFHRSRPRDKFIQECVALQAGSVTFHVFDEGALNTTSKDRSDFLAREIGATSRSVVVPCAPLSNMLDKAWGASTPRTIDFMSIDVEGSEMDVLESNDWVRYKPRVIVIELLGRTMSEVDAAPEVQFLVALGYQPVAMLYHSVVLVSDPELLAEHWGVAASD